ncbi:MAG TPA: adenylate kinase [Gammaproteobacteria bacterium]|jgi:adenylate kinase|nr:adenylate kinase [Gammaproteobacteria bacterium]HIB07408.1 adenylate kinase [Gammaproteobacteria bacterium]HIB81544.1 adenylate kinase [Gammaproteobacteria bacterium]HIM87300.1 adenylate kinase [Gammaproteobacteria bacterium]HIP04974.1 adenylate kinase [Gammaproteobacteria bacterium]
MRIVLLGVPGSGKGTQAKLMAEKYRVPQISSGELLRQAVTEKTELGKRVESIIASGELVSDGIVIDAVTERLRSNESKRGFVLDGFPRTIPQAQQLDTRLGWMNRPLQLVLYFSLSPAVVKKRTLGRLECAECGASYNRYFSPPAKRGICDHCGSKALAQRPDDNQRAVRARLDAYEQDTAPLITYFKAQHKLRTVEGEGEIQDIFERICEIVDTEIRPLETKVIATETGRECRSDVVTLISGGTVVRKDSRADDDKAVGQAKRRLSVVASKKVVKKKAVKKKVGKQKVVKKKVTKRKVVKKKVMVRKSAAKKRTRKR